MEVTRILFFALLFFFGANCICSARKLSPRKYFSAIFNSNVTGLVKSTISGGNEAIPHEFPHVIQIRIGDKHHCGGSLIDLNWVMTSARCIESRFLPIVVVAGAHDLENPHEGEQRRIVKRVEIHPKHTGQESYNIALLKVLQPFELTEYVRPINLPTSFFLPSGVATVTGWGKTTSDGDLATRLRKVTVPLFNRPTCEAFFTINDYEFDDTMICAGMPGSGFCDGDLGTGLICNANSRNPVICGIASASFSCNGPIPDVYTDVSAFVNYIQTIIKTN